MNFTETNLIPNAGLLPAAMLAQRIDLAGLVDQRLQLAGTAPAAAARPSP